MRKFAVVPGTVLYRRLKILAWLSPHLFGKCVSITHMGRLITCEMAWCPTQLLFSGRLQTMTLRLLARFSRVSAVELGVERKLSECKDESRLYHASSRKAIAQRGEGDALPGEPCHTKVGTSCHSAIGTLLQCGSGTVALTCLLNLRRSRYHEWTMTSFFHTLANSSLPHYHVETRTPGLNWNARTLCHLQGTVVRLYRRHPGRDAWRGSCASR